MLQVGFGKSLRELFYSSSTTYTGSDARANFRAPLIFEVEYGSLDRMLGGSRFDWEVLEKGVWGWIVLLFGMAIYSIIFSIIFLYITRFIHKPINLRIYWKMFIY